MPPCERQLGKHIGLEPSNHCVLRHQLVELIGIRATGHIQPASTAADEAKVRVAVPVDVLLVRGPLSHARAEGVQEREELDGPVESRGACAQHTAPRLREDGEHKQRALGVL